MSVNEPHNAAAVVSAENGELAEGWALTRSEDVGKWSTGGTPSRKVNRYFGGAIPYVKSGDLRDGPITETEESITAEGLENSAAKMLPVGTVSIALYGATIGKLGILHIEAATNQACANCQVDERAIERQYLFYYLLHERKALIEAGQGGAQPNLTNAIVRNWPLLLPPLAEQKRIVAKVEELLSAVRAARERLAKVPAILKRFRQSVLAAACSGRLTEDWRIEGPEAESASDLVERVLSDRRKDWERQQSTKMTAKGRRTKNGKWRSKYAAPEDVDACELPGLPESWHWSTLSAICQQGSPVIYGIIKPGPHVPGGVPYVRVMEMRDGVIDVSRLKRAAKERAAKFARATLRAGDLLISKDGTIGKVAVVPAELEGGNITQHLVRAGIHRFLSNLYVAFAIQSPYCQAWLTGELKGVALQGVNVEDFRRLPIPIPPLHERQEIVRRVNTLFKLADAIEQRIAAASARAEKLTQAILAKAFRGELVPTEAELARREGRDYEPASVLLERVRAEREVSGEDGKAKRKSRGQGRKRRRRKPEAVEADAGQEKERKAEKQDALTPSSSLAIGEEKTPIDQIDRDEVMAVIREVFSTGDERQRDEAIRQIAHALGFARVGARIRQVLGDDIRTAVRRGILDNTLYGLSLLCRTIDEYERHHLIDMLLAAMGTTWWHQPEAIRAAAGHLGFRRAGKNIQAAFKSAILTALRRGLLERDGEYIRKVRS